MKKVYKIEGMHCVSCAMLIEGELEDRSIKGKCNFARETLEVESDGDKQSLENVKEAVEAAGYKLKEEA